MFEIAQYPREYTFQGWLKYLARSIGILLIWPLRVWWLLLICVVLLFPITAFVLTPGKAALLLVAELYAVPLYYWLWATFWYESFCIKYAQPTIRHNAIAAIRKEWLPMARHAGLSILKHRPPIKVKGVPVNRDYWIDPALQDVGFADNRCDLVIVSRPGQTAHDIQKAGEQLAAMQSAHHWDSEILAPNAIRISLFFADNLGGMRNSSIPPSGYKGPVIVGRSERGNNIGFDINAATHTALQGMTRSGKSALLYGLLSALSYRDDVLVCGIDPSGVLLAPFKQGRGRDWVHLGSDYAHAAHVLDSILETMESRIRLLQHHRIDKFDAFAPEMPLIAVVLEEYPGLISAARSEDEAMGRRTGEKVRPKLERSVGRLLKEGAKVGIRVILIAQRMSADALDTDDRAQFGRRISLQVDNPDSVRMLHQNVQPQLLEEIMRFPPGRAIFQDPQLGLLKIQSDYTTYKIYRARVEEGINSSSRSNSMRPRLSLQQAATAKPEEAPAPSEQNHHPAEKRSRRQRSRRS